MTPWKEESKFCDIITHAINLSSFISSNRPLSERAVNRNTVIHSALIHVKLLDAYIDATGNIGRTKLLINFLTKCLSTSSNMPEGQEYRVIPELVT